MEAMRRSHRWGLRCLRHLQLLRERDGVHGASTLPFFEVAASSLRPSFCTLKSSRVSHSSRTSLSAPAAQMPSLPAPFSPPPSSLHAAAQSPHPSVAGAAAEATAFRAGPPAVCASCCSSVGGDPLAACYDANNALHACHFTTAAGGSMNASPTARPCTWVAVGIDKQPPPPQQGLYGVVQGGVYMDLRRESAAFVNEHEFFGTAIGGCLGTDRKEMHAIVAETAAMLRKDRPIHLLGIGGMLDIFHGVKQGIDSFDCVQPTRAGRHGSALVPRAFWDDADVAGLPPAAVSVPLAAPAAGAGAGGRRYPGDAAVCTPTTPSATAAATASPLVIAATTTAIAEGWSSSPHRGAAADLPAVVNTDARLNAERSASVSFVPSSASADVRCPAAVVSDAAHSDPQPQLMLPRSSRNRQPLRKGAFPLAAQRVKEYVDIGNAFFKLDDRPILPSCACYACKHFSRGYIHYLLKAREPLGGMLVTMHNVFTVNALMASIRRGIATGTLEQEEQRWIHPSLALEAAA